VVVDLSSVTDGLMSLVEHAWPSKGEWEEPGAIEWFKPEISGFGPDAIRDREEAQLSIFLYHVESDNAQEARFWNPQILAEANPAVGYLPLALNLYYLVSAYSNSKIGYAEEQAAISIALRIFHANAIVHEPAATPAWELSLTMEHRSYDELSRLWQATTAPLRLSVVYRAAVLFLTPEEAVGETREVKELVAKFDESIGSNFEKADVTKQKEPPTPPLPPPEP